MKDSSVSANEAEQKKFSFEVTPVEQRSETVVETRLEPEPISAEQYIEPGTTTGSVDDEADDVLTPAPRQADNRHLPGALLCAERKRRGFTVKEIASQLFLTETQINALEMDHYDHFPAPIFVTGYIRNYARLLDLPPDPLVELFTAQSTQSEPELNHVSRTGSSIKESKPPFDPRVIGGVVAIVVLVPLLWWSMSPSDETTTAVAVVSDEMIGADVDHELVTPFPASEAQEGAPVEVVSSPALVNVSVSAVEEAPAVPSEAVVADAAVEVEVQPVPEFIADRALLPDRLELTFTAESWIEITDANGRRVMFDLGKPGQTRALSGTAPFKVLLGYSPAVSMVYNGEPFDQRKFARGKVARFTLGQHSDQ